MSKICFFKVKRLGNSKYKLFNKIINENWYNSSQNFKKSDNFWITELGQLFFCKKTISQGERTISTIPCSRLPRGHGLLLPDWSAPFPTPLVRDRNSLLLEKSYFEEKKEKSNFQFTKSKMGYGGGSYGSGGGGYGGGGGGGRSYGRIILQIN